MKKLILMLLMLTLSIVAVAAPIDLSTWTGANGQESYTQGIITWTVDFPPNAVLRVSGMGIGVDRPGNDEKYQIDFPEFLLLSFATPVTLNSITFQGLYGLGIVGETLQYSINGTPRSEVVGNLSGTVVVNIGQPYVTSVLFLANNDCFSSGAIRMIDYASMQHDTPEVPEPSTFLLGGGALVAAGFLRKHRKT